MTSFVLIDRTSNQKSKTNRIWGSLRSSNHFPPARYARRGPTSLCELSDNHCSSAYVSSLTTIATRQTVEASYCGFAPDLLLSSGESPCGCRPRNRLTLREVTERCREVSWHCVRSFMLPLLILPGWLVAAQVAHASPSSSPGGAGPASVLASLETTASLIPSRASP